MRPLEDVRVLDLTHAHAGPICTLYMAGMGAEVIKIEPTWGEMTRMFPPLVKGHSPYFLFLNRGKKGVTLNLKDPKGKEILIELLKQSDVVIENFSAGAMERLGLGWEAIKEINPRIIYASITGFGHTGPWKDRKSFDPIAQATSGYMWLMQDLQDSEVPCTAPEAIADTVPGLTCLIGILAALNRRHTTGLGERVDVAQMDSMIATMQSYSFYNMAGITMNKAGRGLGISGLNKTSDGWIMFSLPPGRIMEAFKETVNAEELTPEIVKAWISGKTTDEAASILAKIGVPVGPVLNLDEVQVNEQALAREMFVKVVHPEVGEVIEPGFPIKFNSSKGDVSKPAPLLGEHTNEVLGRLLGMTEKELSELRVKGVV